MSSTVSLGVVQYSVEMAEAFSPFRRLVCGPAELQSS